jgi:hypothetical protein
MDSWLEIRGDLRGMLWSNVLRRIMCLQQWKGLLKGLILEKPEDR